MIRKKFNKDANIIPYKKQPSQVFVLGEAVTTNVGGLLVPITAATLKAKVIGFITRDVRADQSDFATPDTFVGVEVAEPDEDIYEIDVATGTATQAMVDTVVDFANSQNADVTASAIGVLKVRKILSATKIEVSIVR